VPSQQVNAIAIDPVTPQNVYLAGPDGLFRSADGGLAWESLPLTTDSAPVGLALDPHQPATLFALLANGTVWTSLDSGEAWVARAEP
jgi:hypothetical protein